MLKVKQNNALQNEIRYEYHHLDEEDDDVVFVTNVIGL